MALARRSGEKRGESEPTDDGLPMFEMEGNGIYTNGLKYYTKRRIWGGERRTLNVEVRSGDAVVRGFIVASRRRDRNVPAPYFANPVILKWSDDNRAVSWKAAR
jgi:hypothetical protein